MSKQHFVKLNLDLVQKYGPMEALLTCYLFNISKVRKKDAAGWFSLEIARISRDLNLDRKTIRRLCISAAEHRLIQYQPGRNQNIKPQFKVF